LEQLGIALRMASVDVDESTSEGEAPDPYLQRIVQAKLAAAQSLAGADACAAVLVADTSVLIDDMILGKPRDDTQARSMIARLAGRGHVVATRFAVAWRAGASQRCIAKTVRTEVVFRGLSPADVAQYVATGEGRDKAGGYGIQHVGAFLVERITGSYSNVVGLPLAEVTATLQEAGLLGALPVVAERA
jgi:septum formation protein